MNFTNEVVYVNFSKFAEFNESPPTIGTIDFNVIVENILSVFVKYDILQWSTSIIIFIAVFMLLRKETFLDLSDTQVLTLACLVVVAMNGLLLFFNIFSIIQPIQLFFALWLVGVLGIAGKKSF